MNPEERCNPTGKLHAYDNPVIDDLINLREMVRNLEAYLRSEKFAKDPTVQVTDVLTRLGLF